MHDPVGFYPLIRLSNGEDKCLFGANDRATTAYHLIGTNRVPVSIWRDPTLSCMAEEVPLITFFKCFAFEKELLLAIRT
jgi:hypothetical protein